MHRWSTPLLAAALLGACAQAAAPPAFPTPERPIPYPVDVPAGYRAAVEAGTRSATGAPGPRYWQNRADYIIHARVDPAARRVEGTTRIHYHNRSPHPLAQLHLELTLNHHAPGVVRNEPAEVTGGVEVRRVAVGGETAAAGGSAGARYSVANTRMVVVPTAAVQPGETATLDVEWAFTIPRAGAGGRTGHSDDLVYLAYWYPAMAVYDDVVGWHPDPFRGTGEFYATFGRYDVTIEAPPQWVVWGTGAPQNAAENLAPAVLARYRAAIASDTTVAILRPEDFGRATTGGTAGTLAWRFVADSVRDVAYSLARASNWDARRTSTGTGTTEIHAFWRPSAPRWRQMADFQAHAITFLSRYTGIPYPWPHMTAVEGDDIIGGGGMEYPMMTLIAGYERQGDRPLYAVTAHELAHMWVPMIVSTDERRYGWMDEGMTTFHEAMARMDTFPGDPAVMEDRAQYLAVARRGGEGPVMRWSDFHYDPAAYGAAAYAKPSTSFVSLLGLLGEATFTRAWRAFLERWAWKHPYPWDFFATVEEVSGEDLGWFWRTWFYETWTLDQAVASVTEDRRGATIVIEDRGNAPMPARLTITRENGDVSGLEVPVEVWLEEATRTARVTLPPAASPIVRVEIDAENAFPDVDRDNNVWSRP